jgi:NhaB family Na+:H+ antiporter
MSTSTFSAYSQNFLGNSPTWYKQTIIGFLVINSVLFTTVDTFISGWVLLLEFIFTLAMALRCYPMQPGGLLAIHAVAFGMTTPYHVLEEIEINLAVILLLMFMVAAVYFMKDMLLFIFTKLFIKVRSKIALSLMFSFIAAFMSAFLDALTVTAVLIAVFVGFYSVYHKFASGKHEHHDHDHSDDEGVQEYHRSELDEFRAFLRSLVMHGAVGTALGGVCTEVGEPQNVIIGEMAGWTFNEFFLNMAHVTMPVLACGLLTVVVLEKLKWFGYGAKLPDNVYNVLVEFNKASDAKMDARHKAQLVVQMICFVVLVFALGFHIAPAVGLIGLMVMVLLTAFNGVTEEHRLGHAFEEGLPFTSLLVVFFAIIAVINDQNLFTPIIDYVMSLETGVQAPMFFIANGVLSMISDNVFVATVYIGQVKELYDAGAMTKEHFDALAVAINTGTNLPSVATPNGQAAFLFLLTSALAPLIRLSYGKMVWMALPYTIVLGGVGLVCVAFF